MIRRRKGRIGRRGRKIWLLIFITTVI